MKIERKPLVDIEDLFLKKKEPKIERTCDQNYILRNRIRKTWKQCKGFRDNV